MLFNPCNWHRLVEKTFIVVVSAINCILRVLIPQSHQSDYAVHAWWLGCKRKMSRNFIDYLNFSSSDLARFCAEYLYYGMQLFSTECPAATGRSNLLQHLTILHLISCASFIVLHSIHYPKHKFKFAGSPYSMIYLIWFLVFVSLWE